MTEREKVIKGLECCMSEKMCHSPCPYNGECEYGGYYYSKAIEDALALLKAQDNTVCTKERCPVNASAISDDCNVKTCPWRTEAVVPRLVKNRPWFECPVCGRLLLSHKDHYCSGCGKRVKWGD